MELSTKLKEWYPEGYLAPNAKVIIGALGLIVRRYIKTDDGLKLIEKRYNEDDTLPIVSVDGNKVKVSCFGFGEVTFNESYFKGLQRNKNR